MWADMRARLSRSIEEMHCHPTTASLYILNDFTVFQRARSEEQDEGDEYIPYVPVKQRKQQMVSDFHSSICL